MFDSDSRLTLNNRRPMLLANDYIPRGASMLELANSELELADSSTGSNNNAIRISMWVQVLKEHEKFFPILRGA